MSNGQSALSQNMFPVPVPANGGAPAGGCNTAIPYTQAPGFPNAGCPDAQAMRPGAAINISTQQAVSQWLRWLGKAIRDYNRFGFLSMARLRTNIGGLPGGLTGWEVGPDQGQQAIGVNMPIEWTGEAIGCEIYRVELDYLITIQRGTLTPEQVSAGNYRALDFAIVQFGSEDRYNYVLNFGQSRNLGPSEMVPAWSGFYMCADGFVPYFPRVELQSFQLKGTAIGNAPGDAYLFGANVRAYFRRMAD
jgi:hypothetical protein